MRLFRLFAILVLAGTLGGAAVAQMVETTPIPAQPKPDFSPLAFLTGTWNCSVKSSRRPAPYMYTATYIADPSGYWLVETDKNAPATWAPNVPATTETRYTYDAYTKRWIGVTTGGMGTYDLVTSPGWSGNTITWHSVAFAKGPDITSQSDVMITKASANRTTMSSSFDTSTGKHVTVNGTCNKEA
jgi:hypothetical protein